MRIELQWVEFERGTCAIIPVAATAGRPAVINPLVISRFALSQPLNGLGNAASGELMPESDIPQALCQNDTLLTQAGRENIPLLPTVNSVPIVFAEPVVFEVPLAFAN